MLSGRDISDNTGLVCYQGVISVIMLVSKDIYVLINYTSFVESVFMALSVIGLFVLRYTRPDIYRPIKVQLTHVLIAYWCLCNTLC